MIELRDIHKTYRRMGEAVQALKGISLRIRQREFLTILGASGSGKSTLLNIIGGLDFPDTGEVIVEGKPLSHMSDTELTLFRRRRVGYIFQFFNLFPHLTVRENVGLPLLLDGESPRKIRGRIDEIVEAVGLTDRASHLPKALSGGEMQRVAIARALITRPEILLADEPTGNLDSQRGKAILAMIRELATRYERTVIMVTHDRHAASIADRIVHLQDGMIVDDISRQAASP
ncbi:MAG: ABC transporter ATP-binding protein [bacterium]